MTDDEGRSGFRTGQTRELVQRWDKDEMGRLDADGGDDDGRRADNPILSSRSASPNNQIVGNGTTRGGRDVTAPPSRGTVTCRRIVGRQD